MPKTYQLERTQLVRRPLAEVFAFFAQAANLETITPPSLRFHILTPQPIEMAPGATLDYELRLLGIRFRWKTLIESFESNRGFTDSQAKGPYRLWHHTHEFHQVEGGTLVVDRVVYQMPLGWIGRLAHCLFVRRQLEAIFNYRRDKIAELFPDPSARDAAEGLAPCRESLLG